MRRKGEGSRGLPRWVVMLVVVLGGTALIYALACLFLAVYLWFNPIVFQEVGVEVSRQAAGHPATEPHYG